MKFSDAKILIEWTQKSDYKPNAWESDFMESVLEKEKDLTDKQEFCLNRIYEKSSGGGRYQREQRV